MSEPLIRTVGLTGLLVTFSEKFSDAANRAALAFRAAVDAEALDGVEETASTLTSVYLRIDPLAVDMDRLSGRLREMAAENWAAAPLPPGRRLWRVPTVLGGESGPQLGDAARAAGRSVDEARADIAAAQLRVLTLGFAPGQPYMGELPEAWDIPRMGTLNPQVPGGALLVAIRQLIIFAGPAPTGWRHIGQTGFRCYRPEAEQPITLTPGDEMCFDLVDDLDGTTVTCEAL